jgi:hypothetical protein
LDADLPDEVKNRSFITSVHIAQKKPPPFIPHSSLFVSDLNNSRKKKIKKGAKKFGREEMEVYLCTRFERKA